MADEGVIKFRAEHRHQALPPARYQVLVAQLLAWREILALTRLVGQSPERYEGFGYGNVSGRTGAPSRRRGHRSFLVTGTQTSGLACPGLDQFCVVESYDLERNRVTSLGATLPSSESLTHAAIYDLGSHIRFVLHVHSSILWRHAAALRIPITPPAVAYGTTDMARAVQSLYRSSPLAERQILAMGGHEDGLIAFGRSAEEAGTTVLTHLARAYERQSGEAGICGPLPSPPAP